MKRISYTQSSSMDAVLRSHAKRYPLMEPQDAVKLLYQSVFGPGHLISDPEMAEVRLREELINAPSQETIQADDIGGGYFRLHLTKQTASDEALFAFLNSARQPGSPEKMKAALPLFRKLTDEGLFSFDTASLDTYLEHYLADGCPMVRHSPRYREAYAPSYRVVRQEFILLADLIREIRNTTARHEHTVLVLDGFCASGKTTLADFLAQLFQGRLIHMDDFFLPPEKRTSDRLEQPGGNVDYERFYEEVIRHLDDDCLTYGIFDCDEMAVTSHAVLPKVPLTIIEGAYANHPAFGSYSHINVFMETSPEEQIRRILARNGEKMLAMFQSRWIPMEQAYEKSFDIRTNSHYLITT